MGEDNFNLELLRRVESLENNLGNFLEFSKSVKSNVSVDLYAIISRAVEEGVVYGYNRAFKHTDAPDEFLVKEQIEQAVMNSICEILRFNEEE